MKDQIVLAGRWYSLEYVKARLEEEERGGQMMHIIKLGSEEFAELLADAKKHKFGICKYSDTSVEFDEGQFLLSTSAQKRLYPKYKKMDAASALLLLNELEMNRWDSKFNKIGLLHLESGPTTGKYIPSPAFELAMAIAKNAKHLKDQRVVDKLLKVLELAMEQKSMVKL